ncbi:rhamnosyltransferase [Brenneria alni]|uniref:Rhamnosyltransferase n=1 Tax=Brenneria alni TaxID=71656 RepID=A0A421DR08_9GAMM|nr:glycosyltransferase [Brenneria alni]RLM26399.1 rhamnosyltransferase [Brenneria alni]
MEKVKIVIPTYNGGVLWKVVAKELSQQKKYVDDIIIIDSSSSDDTVQYSEMMNFTTIKIPKEEFNHGSTRNKGVQIAGDCNIIIFLTQDAIPGPNCIINIIRAFDDPQVALAYGRQLPHDDANPLAIHARNFNYSTEDFLTDKSKKYQYGIKTVFTSNSFSAYRTDVFRDIGGFPANTILSEDMYFAAKAVLADYKIAYLANACVKHSHNYSPLEEFKRYFDIGVFHHDERWIRDNFGGAGGEGKKFLISEFKFLMKTNPTWIVRACLHNFMKIIGYKLGQNYTLLPAGFVKKLSMHKGFWK